MYIRQRMLFETEMYQDLNPILISSIKFELWKTAYFYKDTLFIRSNVSPYFFSRCLEVMTGRIYNFNDIIIEEGENSYDLYLICTNSVCEVLCSKLLMNTMAEGEFFGETSIFTSSKKRTATVISKTNGDYLVIPGKHYYQLILDFEEERGLFCNYAMRYLMLYNHILTPQEYGLFITKKDKVFKSVMQKNLFKNPPTQNNALFYRKHFEEEENEKIFNKQVNIYQGMGFVQESLEELQDENSDD